MWEVTEEIVKRKLKMHKHNARKRNIKCTLTVEQLHHLLTINSGFCDYTSEPMSLYSETSDVRFSDQVTLERISEYGFYELNNILLVRADINYLKSVAIETKSNWNPESVTIELKEKLNSIYKIIYNPIKLKEVQSKYLNYNKEGQEMTSSKSSATKLLNTLTLKKLNKETTAVPSESSPETLLEEITVNSDIGIAENYARLGRLVGTVATFDLSFSEYKRKFSCKKDGLTGNTWEEGEEKALFWLDKTKSFSKDNTVITTKVIAEALDVFVVSSKLNGLTELKKLCKVIASK